MSASTTSLTAIILAGGKAKPPFAEKFGVTNRAMVNLAGDKTMLDFVVDAVAGAVCVGQIFVIGDVAVTPVAGQIAPTILPSGKSLIDNIIIGLNTAKTPSEDRVLLVSADIPFVTSQAIDDYSKSALASEADFCYPIIPMDDYRRQYAQMKRTTLKVREGEFTGGNVMLMRAAVLKDHPEPIHAAYAARKSPFALGGLLGWGLLLKIVASQVAFPNLITIPELEKGVGRVLGNCIARAIVTKHASIGTDIDKPDDVAIARQILGTT